MCSSLVPFLPIAGINLMVTLSINPNTSTCPTAGVTGKGGTWRTKPPDAESAHLPRVLGGVGARILKVWANARTCPVHAVLGAA